jgi:hypothetical protein
MAGPGEAGWNPVDADTRRPSCRIPFDPIEGDASGEGTFSFPGGYAETPAITGAELHIRLAVLLAGTKYNSCRIPVMLQPS